MEFEKEQEIEEIDDYFSKVENKEKTDKKLKEYAIGFIKYIFTIYPSNIIEFFSVYFIIIFIFSISILVSFYEVHSFPLIPKNANLKEFSEERTKPVITYLSETIGTHQVGTEEHEKARIYILEEIQNIVKNIVNL
jgi:hypothetical protein